MPQFIVRLPDGKEDSLRVDRENIFVGRVPSINDLAIAHPSVSRQHAHIAKTPKGYVIQDLKSLNGIFRCGKRISKGPLKDGDRIELGDVSVLFRMQADAESEADLLRRYQETQPGLTAVSLKKRDPD